MNSVSSPIKSGNFSGFEIEGKNAPKDVFRLRYDVFIKKLKWLPENKLELDYDYYDNFSTILYVTNSENKVVGTLRIIDSYNEFMLDNDFKSLIEKAKDYNKTEDSAEISRLGIENIDLQSKITVIQILFQLLQNWLKVHNKNYFYFVTTNKYASRLSKSYGIEMYPIGKVSFTEDNLAFSTFKVYLPKTVSLSNKIKRFLYLNVFRRIFI